MDKFQKVVFTISMVIAAVFFLLFSRLAYLQLFDHESLDSRSGSIRRISIQAPRGHLIDRNGQTILENRPLYTVKIIPSELKESSIGYLAYLMEMPEEELRQKIREGREYNKFTPKTVYRDLNEFAVARVSENLWQLPGVVIEVENKRKYSDLFRATHLFGYLRGVTKKQLETLAEKGYSLDDKIGFIGLEKIYEEQLKGEKGARFELVNPLGVFVGKYENGENDRPSVKGDDLYLTIDAGLQELAEKLLRETGRSGAVVAIDPSTGGVLTLCSQPDFDLDILNGTTRKKEWAEIALSPRKPLFNRAIQAAYPPGSTYKLLLSLAALEEGVITAQKTIYCPGYFMYGGRKFKCHGGAHGPTNLNKAITQSCNTYFYKLILDVGLDRWSEYGRMFGFGQKEGIDLPNEKSGTLPSTEYYNRRYGAGRWTNGYIVSLGIGQGEMNATPLQLANFAATIANGGTWRQPHIVRGYRSSTTGEYVALSHESRRLGISQKNFDIVRKGMEGVVLEGTGTLAKVEGVTVAGKTGTAQNPHGQDHAWFMCFAPADKPKIAIAVLVENAGFGGSVSAPIARELIRYYVGPKPVPGTISTTKAVATVKAISDSLDSKQKAKTATAAATDSTGAGNAVEEVPD